MRWNKLLFLSLLRLCRADRRWKLFGCDPTTQSLLSAAFTETVTIAETATDVLNNNMGDQHVQDMLNNILGPDPASVQRVRKFEINEASGEDRLTAIATLDRQPSPFLGVPGGDNLDVLVYCDASNFDVDPANGMKKNKAMSPAYPLPIGQEASRMVDVCYNGVDGVDDNLPLAMTSSSNEMDVPSWKAAVQQWREANAGAAASPNPNDYSIPHPDRPNTMNLCKWYLEIFLGDSVFNSVSDTAIARVQDPSFISELSPPNKPINALVQGLTGTLLHELTHTNLGGMAVDSSAPGGCYGWECVSRLHDENNADSIAFIGVCMYLFKKGFFVNNDGMVENISS